MPREPIQPEKVTRPFQLLAAWLVTLIALDTVLLTGARFITEPAWVVGLLSIAAVFNIPVFLISMFILQTRFRPEMQDDKYYATYLKGRKETAIAADKLIERLDASGLDIQSLVTAQRKLSDLSQADGSEIKHLLADLRSRVAAQERPVPKVAEPDPKSILALARGFLAEQDWREAAAEFTRYACYHPEDWEASYARGVAYANSREGEGANLASVRAYSDAITYAPLGAGNSFRARLFAYRGAMFKRLNRLEEAEADLNVARRHASAEYERLDVAYNLACIYALQKRREDLFDQIQLLKSSRRYLGAVRSHLTDYFANYTNDQDFIALIRP